MKITLPSFLLLFILTTAINAQQKIGFKIILDQNFTYDEYVRLYNGRSYGNYLVNHKRKSMSYGLTYEKAISNKFLTSIETGLYLNTQSSSGISSDGADSALKYYGYFSINGVHTLERKITELHIPILIKKYFYIKSALFFVSAGPKLALTLYDKTFYEDVKDNSTLMKRNNFDFKSHPSRFYLINTLNINLGFEYKKVQISTSYALSNIRNLHSERTERDSYSFGYYGYDDNSFRTFLLSLSIGYTL